MLENDSVEQSNVEVGTQDASPASSPEVSGDSNNQSIAQAMHDLEKLGKFRVDGKEMSYQDLKKSMMLHGDYTKKTQAFAAEKKALETFKQQEKFQKALSADLEYVKNNPGSASDFIKVYPQEYHQYLKFVLDKQAEVNKQESAQTQAQPQVDYQLLSRLQQIENTIFEQTVEKNTMEIESQLNTFGAKYPNVPKTEVLAKIIELDASGKKVDAAAYEKAFKEIEARHDAIYKERYKQLQTKQTQANKKAKDVSAGGGTIGRAPQKFTKLSDVTKFAIEDLTRKA